MKNLSLLFIAFLLLQFTSFAQEDWIWQNPLPQGSALNDVWMIDEENIIAVGDVGAIIKSTNGGIDWINHIKITSYDLLDLHFINENTGWAVGKGGVTLNTINAGEDWVVINQGDNDSTAYYSVYFIDNNIGWISKWSGWNSSSKIYKTTDGGNSWILKYTTIEHSENITSIKFVNQDIGWATTSMFGWGNYGRILKTTNGGNDWVVQLDSQGSAFISMEIIDFNTVWVVGDSRGPGFGPSTLAYKTTNGGDDWEVNTEFYAVFNSICFSDSMYGWLVGNNGWEEGLIFTSIDGGESWFEQQSSTPSILNKVSFSDYNTGCAVGDNGTIMKTTDGGGEWDLLTKGYANYLSSAQFVNSNTGWATGGESILKTMNSGEDWIEQFRLTSGSFINSIFFIDENRGWAVGGEHDFGFNYKVLKTTNGGNDWIGLSWGGYQLTSVFFIDPLTGWATEYLGKILKTTDGGGYWYEVYDVGNELGSIFFIDPNSGWTAGEGIYNTTDGGSNWIQQSTAEINSIFFINSNYGWAAGTEGNNDNPILYRTTNGGVDWIDVIVIPPGPGIWGNLNSVNFTDLNNGWAVGLIWRDPGFPVSHPNDIKPTGLILHTTDGGESWNEQSIMTHNSLTSVYFVDSNIGWIVGEGGTILHTTNGGVSFVEEEEIDGILTDYSLSNNFPNPFNPSTKIRYSVPQSSSVTLKVYDVLGNEIEILVNEEKPAGTYELTWYAEQLPSGIYFYRLQAGDFIQTKKMILLK